MRTVLTDEVISGIKKFLKEKDPLLYKKVKPSNNLNQTLEFKLCTVLKICLRFKPKVREMDLYFQLSRDGKDSESNVEYNKGVYKDFLYKDKKSIESLFKKEFPILELTWDDVTKEESMRHFGFYFTNIELSKIDIPIIAGKFYNMHKKSLKILDPFMKSFPPRNKQIFLASDGNSLAGF